MSNKKLLWVLAVPAILSLVLTLILYTVIPSEIATSWDASGDPEHTRPRYILILTALLPLVFIFILHKTGNLMETKLHGTVAGFATVILIGYHWYIIARVFSIDIALSLIVRILIAAIFAVTGSYLRNLRQRTKYAIHTPWTLDHDRVWLDTQHAGGMIFFVAAAVLAITSPLGQAAGFFTLAAVVIAIAASVFVYSRNREKRFISSSR
jgi:uncharacterized membrane protein